MLVVKMKYSDGEEFVRDAKNLSEAKDIINAHATARAASTWTGAWGVIYPMFWAVMYENDARVLAKGLASEDGICYGIY